MSVQHFGSFEGSLGIETKRFYNSNFLEERKTKILIFKKEIKDTNKIVQNTANLKNEKNKKKSIIQNISMNKSSIKYDNSDSIFLPNSNSGSLNIKNYNKNITTLIPISYLRKNGDQK